MLQSSVQDSNTPSGYFDALLCGSKGHSTASLQPATPDLSSLAATHLMPLGEQLQGILLLPNICNDRWRRHIDFDDLLRWFLTSGAVCLQAGQYLGDVLHFACSSA